MMKKVLSLIMALAMALTLAVPAMAATTGTVKNDTDRTYNAYQIFSGTQATNSATLGDIAWGNGIDSANFLTALKEIAGFEACENAAEVAEVLKAFGDNSDTAKAFADLAEKHVTNSAATVEANDTAILDSGYYLLVDTSTTHPAQNPALLQVTNDSQLNITDKSDVPVVDKTIKDEGEVAAGSIGDTFTFVLTATMPETFEGYESYKVVFHDTLSKGLTYNNDAKVSVEGFQVESEENANGDTIITVTNDNVLDNNVAASGVITVTYTATLNGEAVIGGAGNPNEVYLEYSHDPNSEQSPTKNTTSDKVVVFTFELDVTKVDGEKNEITLEGAEFKLKNSEGKWAVVEDGKLTGWADTQEKGTTLISGSDGLFVIKGLDEGTYELHETKAPAGYNKLQNPITLEIVATEVNDEDVHTQQLTALVIKVGENEEAGNVTSGVVTMKVENNSGAQLPETGGMGTTLFYALGAALVLGAGVAMVTKKRMA